MPSTSCVAILLRAGLLTDTMLDPDTIWARPMSRVPVPRVTTKLETSMTTTKNALTAPASRHTPIATRQASHTFQPCMPARTGTRVAAMPMTEAMDRSNSPTTRVIIADMARKTRTCWLPKIEEKAPQDPNRVGMRM